MEQLMICEKKSVADALADYFERHGAHIQKMNGYLMNQDTDMVITWLAGHVLSSDMPQDMDPAMKSWKYPLPIVPKKFTKHPNPQKINQYNTVTKLISEASRIINAGDPDREGQVLVDELLDDVRGKIPIQRLLLKGGMNDHDIAQSLAGVFDNQKQWGLYRSGLMRNNIDWLIGINLTRHFTNKWHEGYGNGTIPIGRVKTPTTALVVKREREIQAFSKETYYNILIRFMVGPDEMTASMQSKDKILSETAANAMAVQMSGKDFAIRTVQPVQKENAVKKLYQLSTLQVDADRYFDIDVKKTLDTLESLYLKGYTTYPRSECEYLSNAERLEAPKVAKALNAKLGIEIGTIPISQNMGNPNLDKSPVFDDKKVGAHHAIIPTETVPDLDKLEKEEREIYLLIVRKYASIFYPVNVYTTTTVTGECQGKTFVFKYKRTKDPGWTILYPKAKDKKKGKDDEEKELPINISAGSVYTVKRGEARKVVTKPPKRYTTATLVDAMYHARSQNEELNKTLREVKGIGTSATQASIVAELIQTGMLKLKGKEILPTDIAMQTTELLPSTLTEPDYTAMMENQLTKLERGEVTEKELLDETVNFIKLVIDGQKEPLYSHEYPCPACGKGYILIHHWKDKETGETREYARCNNRECGQFIPLVDGKPCFDNLCPDCHKGYIQVHTYTDKKTGEERQYARCNNKDCGHFFPMADGKPCIEYPCPKCGHGYIVPHSYTDKTTGETRFYSRCDNKDCKQYYPVVDGKPKVVECPECKIGFMTEKRNSKDNSLFYSCSRYPECRKTMKVQEFLAAKTIYEKKK